MNESVQKNNIKAAPVVTDSNQWGRRNSAAVAIASSMSFESVGYKIDGKPILEDISLSVEPGQVLCLLGPSGSGKTSLLRIAAGLIEGASGTVKINDLVVADHSNFIPPEKRGVGLVFQDHALFPHLTIQQNVEFGLTALGREDARLQASRILSRVGLSARAGSYPHTLSGGEQQRIALARALAPRPGILLMDEPFSGLDSRLRDSIREQSLELLKETRSTAIIVTHDAEEALRVGDRIALIRDGKLVQQGTGHDLYYRPRDLFTAGFFSEINVVPVKLVNGQAQTLFGNWSCDADLPMHCCAAIRLTDIEVTPDDGNASGQLGRIASRRFIGTSELLDINVEGLDAPITARIKAGALSDHVLSVRVSVDPQSMMIFPIG